MAHPATVTIEHLEVKRSDLNGIKQLFRVTDDTEAVQKALDLATGKVELEQIFSKHKNVDIEKIYA